MFLIKKKKYLYFESKFKFISDANGCHNGQRFGGSGSKFVSSKIYDF